MISVSPPRTAIWQASIRYEAAKARPWMGLRHALGVALPAAIGILSGQAAGGLIAATGALNVAVSDGPEPYLYRARRMAVASLFCGLAVFAGELAGASAAASVVLLAAGAFAAGLMVAAGSAASDIALIAFVTLVVYSAQPASPPHALAAGAVALGGGLFQTALAVALWPLRRRTPERRTLSALYLELARAAAAPPDVREAPPASRESTDAQQALSAGADGSLESERYLALLSQGERIRLTLLTLARLHVRIGREDCTELAAGILRRSSTVTAEALRAVAQALLSGRPADSAARLPGDLADLAEQLRPHCGDAPPQLTAMLQDARAQLDALAGQLRTALELASHTTPPGFAEFERRDAARPWRLRLAGLLSTLHANLRLESTAFRHGLRLAACVIFGELMGRGLEWQRAYWIPMTIALVLKPDFTTTFSRGVQRLSGTLIGLLVTTALFHFLNPPAGAQIACLFLFAFVLRAYGPANYGILAVAVTSLVVFMFAIVGISPAQVMLPRGWSTLAGGVIALAAYALWPTWERTQAPEALARMLDAYRAYFQAVRDGYLQPGVATPALDRARLAARLARFNLEASLARLRAEPGSSGPSPARLDSILADSHRFIHAVMSLEAGLLTSPPVPARDAFRTFSNHVDLTLYYLAQSLRGSPVAPADLPDLREDHHALLHSGDARVQRYALVNVETDRVVNSLNTLAGEILAGLGR